MKTKIIVMAAVTVAVLITVLMLRISANKTWDKSDPRSLPNSYLFSESVIIEKPVEEVFQFITYEHRYLWSRMSKEHQGQTHEILNADGYTEGAVIVCEEYAEGEGTSHRYVVKEVIENQLIHYASEPSIVYSENRNGEMKQVTTCNTYVYFDMEPQGDNRTKLTQTLVIQMPNFLIKFLTDAIGGEEGEEVWRHHLQEELEGSAFYMVNSAETDFLN